MPTPIEQSLDDIVDDLNVITPVIQALESGVEAKKTELEAAVDLAISSMETQIDDALNSSFSNPNMIDNPDFAIDQRGAGNGSLAFGQFARDRWRNSGGTASVSVVSGLVTLTGLYYQNLENTNFQGRTVTISAKNVSVNIEIRIGETTYLTLLAGSSVSVTGIWQIGGTAPDIFGIKASSGFSAPFSFEDLKVEFGDVATPFIPPHPQVELAKCQRHLYRFSSVNLQGAGFVRSSVSAFIILRFPVRMYSTPTVTLNFIAGTLIGSTNRAATGYTPDQIRLDSALLLINCAGGLVTGQGIIYYSTGTDDYIQFATGL